MAKQDTRQRIIKAALVLFSEKGFTATTREIAFRADVNELTIFRHFGSKYSLIQEIIHQCSPVSSLWASVDERLKGNLHLDLQVLAKTFLDIELNQMDRIRLGIIEAPNNPQLLQVVSQIPNQLRIHLVNYLDWLHRIGIIRCNNLELLAEIFYSILFQYVLAKSEFPSGQVMNLATPEEVIDAVVSLFVNGLIHE